MTEGDDRPPEKETVLSKIAKNPVVNLLIGVGGIIIGLAFAAGFYFLVEQKEIKPRYAVSAPETLAEATADAPGLKLLWESEEIKNVHTIDIVIWNAGRQFLDKGAISATDPIRVTYPPDVQILYAKFVCASRDNLQLTATDLASADTRAMQLEIVGDEALERRDGGLLKVLFSGPTTNEFAVTGRVKGSRGGFTRVDWNDIATKQGRLSLVLVTALMIVLGGFALWALARVIRATIALEKLLGGEIDRHTTAIIPSIRLGSILLVGFWVFWVVTQLAKPFLSGLRWLP